MLCAVRSARVNSGVMSPLRVSAEMRAASAPLNLLPPGGYLPTSARGYLAARWFRGIQVRTSGAAAGWMRSAITSACTRPAEAWMPSDRLNASAVECGPGDAGR
jgi:hypothetical protein